MITCEQLTKKIAKKPIFKHPQEIQQMLVDHALCCQTCLKVLPSTKCLAVQAGFNEYHWPVKPDDNPSAEQQKIADHLENCVYCAHVSRGMIISTMMEPMVQGFAMLKHVVDACDTGQTVCAKIAAAMAQHPIYQYPLEIQEQLVAHAKECPTCRQAITSDLCRQIQALLPTYHNGVLTDQQIWEVEDHFQDCWLCSECSLDIAGQAFLTNEAAWTPSPADGGQQATQEIADFIRAKVEGKKVRVI